MWNDARTTNLIANTLAVLAVGAMLLAGVAWVGQRPYFTLSAIELEPMPDSELHYVSPGAVRAAIAGRFKGNFFTVDLDDARTVFESVPWVRHATVRRIWPNVLRVRIEEQQPLALWNENQMINTWGEAFTANTGEVDDETVLPQFSGPEGTESLVVQRYAELARWFAPLDMHVKQLELSPRYAWRVVLSTACCWTWAGIRAPTRRIRTACRARCRSRRAFNVLCRRGPPWPDAWKGAPSPRPTCAIPMVSHWRWPRCRRRKPSPNPYRNLPRNANAMTRDIKDLIVALDIGTSKVVAVVAEILPEGRFEVLGLGQHESRGMRKGVVVNIETTVNSIQRALEEAELMADCKIRDVYTGIAGSHIRSFNSSGMVAVKDIRKSPPPTSPASSRPPRR